MKKTLKDINLKNKRVIVRVDFNVPLDANLNVTDDTRIRETLPTINYLKQEGAKIILMAHLGRPKGKVEPKYSLKPAAAKLSQLLGQEVKMAPGCIDTETKKLAMSLNPGEILLLENLRFHPEEEKNDPAFANELASMAEIFVQDAFGTVHRAHSSTEGIAKYLPSCAGLLLEKEIIYFAKALEKPEKTFVAILGGAKVSDKIMVIENLLNKVDALIIGGAMAYTFLKSKGINVGNSLVEQDKLEIAAKLLKKADEKQIRLFLPIDHVISTKIDGSAESQETKGVEILENWMGVDIGKMTLDRISSVILGAKTIIWNGPMGVFEVPKFANGTMTVANLVAQATSAGAVSIIGGGDSVAAVKKAGVSDKISHISTGGGASLELLEGKILPGIAVLPEK
ncbi:MAG: phosphoglycerate kinase [Elusimicrobia bacterium RIFOXYA2_FULL_39_19]|nr:MAG: phosphoglycerate kinase [Elusimicrobia bacterium RIFOXYA2_FULL_39_19]